MIDYQKWQAWNCTGYAWLRCEQIAALALLGERKRLLGITRIRKVWQ